MSSPSDPVSDRPNKTESANSDAIRIAKTSLREQVRSALRDMSADARRCQSLALSRQLLAVPEVGQASCLLAFWPMSGEPDITGALIRLRDSGTRILLPVIRKHASPRLGFADLTRPEALTPAVWGILEPGGPLVDPSLASAAITPCLAVTERGLRLGHGGGYYDELLAHLSIPTICPIFEAQLIPEIPVDLHDAPISVVVSPSRVIRIGSSA